MSHQQAETTLSAKIQREGYDLSSHTNTFVTFIHIFFHHRKKNKRTNKKEKLSFLLG